MIRVALVTCAAVLRDLAALGTLRAAHERRYRRNVERIALGPAELRERLFDDLCADWAREIEFSLPDVVTEWEAR